jgi:hypothetical protein
MDFYVIFLVYCIQFSYKQACGGFAFKVQTSNRLNTRRLSRLSTFKILLVQIEIVFLCCKTEMDLQQILHVVPGEFFPEGRPPFLRKTVQTSKTKTPSK